MSTTKPKTDLPWMPHTKAWREPWPPVAAAVDLAPGAEPDILAAAVADALGRGWAPRTDAERTDAGWRGWFTAGGKRFALEVRLDYGPGPLPPEAEAEIAEADKARERAENEEMDARDEAERLEKKVDAWKSTVEAACEGDGTGAVEAAKNIPSRFRP